MDVPPTSTSSPAPAPAPAPAFDTPAAGLRARHAAFRGDRLRWGLTGLAAVFLIVLVAAAGLRPSARDEKPGAGEPLAVLGVAPGPATRPDPGPSAGP